MDCEVSLRGAAAVAAELQVEYFKFTRVLEFSRVGWNPRLLELRHLRPTVPAARLHACLCAKHPSGCHPWNQPSALAPCAHTPAACPPCWCAAAG